MAQEYLDYICQDLDRLYTLLEVPDNTKDLASFMFHHLHPMLATSRICFPLCAIATNKSTCKADYYPNMITRKVPRQKCTQELEYDIEYLWVLKHSVWVHRKIAFPQENVLHHFHLGWSNFADWVNNTTNNINISLIYGQSQHLFIEHFSRHLLVAYGKMAGFLCEAHAKMQVLAAKVRNVIGKNGGIIAGAMQHGCMDGCMDCTHVKCYMGAEVNGGNAVGVVGLEPGVAQMAEGVSLEINPTLIEEEPLPADMPHAPSRETCAGGTLWIYYTVGNGWEKSEASFSADAVTCDDAIHIAEHKQYEDRFHHLSFPGVQRVIWRQMAAGDTQPQQLCGPSFQVQLQALGGACGVPIAQGKCYCSESTPQVLGFINKVWVDYPQLCTSFVVYDKACDLCQHIVTQDATDLSLTSTKVIVDAWHYIGHQATDVLCQTKCNPALTDGSQPDLVLTELNNHGISHQTRAFNTETVEQLNSWLNGFESQLCQMTDINYNFFIHVWMLLYREKV
ncbi:hypothetical protein B0H16DRAFT_1480757 [Mycena metata]|uniref:CxC5 like cysteine cluster associated with KDZ domain-containing protein n=1 Tax=Mycena metata TaxID=1033252 RepID=A0AAD7H2J5_9AGAR|nr:hypothetical protein B0H16DRAFT_1480757 [Mycena metata]